MRGYRSYRVNVTRSDVILQGARVEWPEAGMVASCYDTGMAIDACWCEMCGIYSYKRALHADLSDVSDGSAMAEVENFDTVYEHESGYRASRTRIMRLWYYPEAGADANMTLAVTRALHARYGVPVEATDYAGFLRDTGEYEVWVGLEQVRATNRLIRPFGGRIGSLLGPNERIVSVTHNVSHFREDYLVEDSSGQRRIVCVPAGSFSTPSNHFVILGMSGGNAWGTSGGRSGNTPTSQSLFQQAFQAHARANPTGLSLSHIQPQSWWARNAVALVIFGIVGLSLAGSIARIVLAL